MTKEELNKHFVEWFYNSNWVEGYNRNGWMRDHFNNGDADQRHYWMLEAYMAGFELQQKLYVEEMDKMFDDMDEAIDEFAKQPLPDSWPFPSDTTTIQTTQFASKAAWPFPGE